MLITLVATEKMFHLHSGKKYNVKEIEEYFHHDPKAFGIADVHKCECCGYYFIGDGVVNPTLSNEQLERGNNFHIICKECFAASNSIYLDTIPFYYGLAFVNQLINRNEPNEILLEGGFLIGD